MGTETRLFKTEERTERGTAARMLRELADRIDAGRVVLRSGGRELVLEPSANVVFEVQAEREERSSGETELKIEVEVSWAEGPSDHEGETTGRLELG
jgi:amphi-Trp domain-containing protein